MAFGWAHNSKGKRLRLRGTSDHFCDMFGCIYRTRVSACTKKRNHIKFQSTKLYMTIFQFGLDQFRFSNNNLVGQTRANENKVLG